MNNQLKLIDAEKLLKWIEEDKDAEGFWGEGERVHRATCSFDNLTDAINEGKFDPDTPPVPTIKPGDKELWEAVKIEEVGQFIQSLIENGHYNIKTGRSTESGYRLVAWTEHLEVVE